MTNSRRRSRDTSDDDSDIPSRIVIPRRSIFAEDSNPPTPVNHPEPVEPSIESDPEEDPESDPEEYPESDPEEEPSEDEEEPHPTLSRSPSTIPPPVPSSPIIPPSPVLPPLAFATRRHTDFLRWDWMPSIINWWRRAEQIPVLPEASGSNTPIPILTQEPVHHTMPVVIARLVTHDHQFEKLEQANNDRSSQHSNEMETIQHKVSTVENGLAELRDDIVESHNDGVEQVMRVRRQMEEIQQRFTTMEQEMASLRAENGRLERVVASMTRVAELLEGMNEH